MKVKTSLFLIALTLITTSCSNIYQSKTACERELARSRGSVAGILVGGSFGDGIGSAVGSVAGNIIGAEVGEAIYESGDHKDKADTPYKKNFFTGCEPVKST